MKMSRLYMLFIFAVLTCTAGFAQDAREWARKGNEALEAGNNEDALRYFSNALKEEPENEKYRYNAAVAKYRTENYEEAGKDFMETAQNSEDKELKADAFHNSGNSFMKQEKWEESVEAFKQSLMNDPADEDTRRNLSHALRKLQEQQEQEQEEENEDEENEDQEEEEDQEEDGEGEDGENNEDEEQDSEEEEDGEQDQDEGEDKEDEEEGGSDREEEQDGEQDQEQQRPDQISQQDAERILDALLNEEKDVRESIDKGQPAKGKEIEKEW